MSKEISKKNKADQRWILEDNNKPAFPRGNRTWLCLHNYSSSPLYLIHGQVEEYQVLLGI